MDLQNRQYRTVWWRYKRLTCVTLNMGLIRNGKSDDELREEAAERQMHQMNLSAAQADNPMNTAYIGKMTDHNLDDPTVDILANLLDQDFLLGNLQEAEVHEYRWLARVMMLEVEAIHPNDQSVFAGELRAVAFDDNDDALSPLSPREKAVIEQFIMGVISRATRGRDGWQQEMFNKTITASETRQVGDDDDGGFLSS
jgi:hypothetical protein